MLRPPSLQRRLDTLGKPIGQNTSTDVSPRGIFNGGKLLCIANLQHGPDEDDRNVSNITCRQQCSACAQQQLHKFGQVTPSACSWTIQVQVNDQK